MTDDTVERLQAMAVADISQVRPEIAAMDRGSLALGGAICMSSFDRVPASVQQECAEVAKAILCAASPHAYVPGESNGEPGMVSVPQDPSCRSR